MWIVYENGMEATFENFPVEKTWDNACFPTFKEALAYAKRWTFPLGKSWDGKAPFCTLDGGKVTIEFMP